MHNRNGGEGASDQVRANENAPDGSVHALLQSRVDERALLFGKCASDRRAEAVVQLPTNRIRESSEGERQSECCNEQSDRLRCRSCCDRSRGNQTVGLAPLFNNTVMYYDNSAVHSAAYPQLSVNQSEKSATGDLRNSRFSVSGQKRGFDVSSSVKDSSADSTKNQFNTTATVAAKYQVICDCPQSADGCVCYENAQFQPGLVTKEATVKFNMMNGNVHLTDADAQEVAMETSASSSARANGASNPPPANVLNKEQQQMLEQLNVMSLSERRLGFAATKNRPRLTPKITLTSVDDEDEDGCERRQSPTRCCEEMIIDSIGDYGSEEENGPLSPNFLAVPKLQEVGKERRPPAMVKSM